MVGLAGRARSRRAVAHAVVLLRRGRHLEAQHHAELPAEVQVAERIQERVHRRVDVADPRHRRHEALADAAVAEGDDHEADEVGEEAEGEGAHDDAELARRLDLAL